MSQLRVLIVCASIAGPTAAYWFAKAGASVTVIERFPQMRTGGQNIDIRTSGVTVMRRMPGMEAAVRAKSAEIDSLCFVRENGQPYGIIRATGNPDQQSLLSEYEIFRGDLAQELHDLTKNNKNIKYLFNEQIAPIQQDKELNSYVTVEFTNDSPNAEYDLVVACDVATSRTRAIGLGCGVRDHIHPTNCWAAYFSIKQDLLQGSKMGHAHNSVPGRFMAIGPYSAGGNIINMTALHPQNGPDATASLRDAMKQGDHSLKEYIANHFKGHGWKTEEVLAALIDTDDLYANEVVQVKVPSLHNGRFALVGDAGYAPGFTGTGTTLAITGAYVLAGEICKHKGNLKAGLEGYERTMRPIITEMSKVSPLVSTFLAPQTAWGLWLRNNIFALIAWSNLLDYAQRLLGSFAGNASEYPLPEYEWVE